MVTCIHKHYSVQEWVSFAETNPEAVAYIAVACGTSDAEFSKLQEIMALIDVPFVCIDVANGYSEFVSVQDVPLFFIDMKKYSLDSLTGLLPSVSLLLMCGVFELPCLTRSSLLATW